MKGLFIGSFNPPTLAHLEICLKLKNRLEEIIFIPVNSPSKHLISINRRVDMLNIYCHKYSFLKVDKMMEKYSSFNFRILDLLKDKYQDITIIMGSDLLNNLHFFDNYLYLLENYSFIIITRFEMDTKKIIDDYYHEYIDKFTILEYQRDISSTKARELVKKKLSTKDILDKDIHDYIVNNHLYV